MIRVLEFSPATNFSPSGREGSGYICINLYSAFRQRAFLISAVSHLPSVQGNPYTKVPYLGIAYSVTLQLKCLRNGPMDYLLKCFWLY